MSWLSAVVAAIGLPVSFLYFIDYLLSLHKREDVGGKIVLITGANSGLGRACAEVFYKAGCKVILAGRNIEELKKVQSELMGTKQDANSVLKIETKILHLDLTDLKNMSGKAAEAASLFGGVDMLINNAGITYRGRIEDTDIQVDQRLMAVNYFGQVSLTKAILPYLLERGGGHIVAVSSVQGRFSIPYRSSYSASKYALQSFFDCLRAEYSDSNIKVCVVSPGYIKTNLSQNAVCADGSKYGVVDNTTAGGMPADEVATVILQTVQGSKSEVVPAPLLYRLLIVLRTLLPNIFFKVMNIRAKKQRKDYIKHN